MGSAKDPYDQLPYRSRPIEWSAPERLALASVLHGGPRPPLDGARVLELGCGAAENLIPLAYYRRRASFVGVDGAGSRVELGRSRARSLGLDNLELIHADFRAAEKRIRGDFDFILAHGIFSWVPDAARDALLRIFARRLRPGGLVYVNYNCRPGWDVRGLVRDFLLAQTAGAAALRWRSERARAVAAKVASALTGVQHPYSQLLADEFRFVAEGDVSYVAHEFLSPDNRAYWRSEFLSLARAAGLAYVADADFNYASGRTSADLPPALEREGIRGRSVEDTLDLLRYRQLHSPILAAAPLVRKPYPPRRAGELYVASCLEAGAGRRFRHPSGAEVEAKEEWMRAGLAKLRTAWPRGLRMKDVFPVDARTADDLLLLHRNGLLDLRLEEPAVGGPPEETLNRLERRWGDCVTSRDHRISLVAAEPASLAAPPSAD